MGIENHVTAKIEWTGVKTAQAQLDQLWAMVIKPVTEVPPAESVLSSVLHHVMLGCSTSPGILFAVCGDRVFGRWGFRGLQSYSTVISTWMSAIVSVD